TKGTRNGGQMLGRWRGRGRPVFIDAIIQSNGAGFVGTRGCTMSTLASRRYRWPGADDH
ncbi:uncharacterized protein HD556DRAFT_1420220, partial [Suillus plorans]